MLEVSGVGQVFTSIEALPFPTGRLIPVLTFVSSQRTLNGCEIELSLS